jgi:hypothetical protein
MCPICGELETGSGQTLVPAALGGDCKGNAAFVFDGNADSTVGLSLESTGFVGSSPRVRGLESCCPLLAEATEQR